MRILFKYLLITLALVSSLNAGMARGGLLTFTQPDGTQFEGYLKGDSAFHWIESGSKVVIFNPSDKFYYIAKVNAKGILECSSKRPDSKLPMSQSAAVSLKKESPSHQLDKSTKDALHQMQKRAKQGNHPQ